VIPARDQVGCARRPSSCGYPAALSPAGRGHDVPFRCCGRALSEIWHGSPETQAEYRARYRELMRAYEQRHQVHSRQVPVLGPSVLHATPVRQHSHIKCTGLRICAPLWYECSLRAAALSCRVAYKLLLEAAPATCMCHLRGLSTSLLSTHASKGTSSCIAAYWRTLCDTIGDAGSMGWNSMLRSGSGVLLSHRCCAAVIGAAVLLSNRRQGAFTRCPLTVNCAATDFLQVILALTTLAPLHCTLDWTMQYLSLQ